MPELNYSLEINLTKAKGWVPTKVEEIPEVISRAFETHVTLKEIQPLIGTDHVQKWPIKEDSDIPVFINAKSQMREAFVEKVIKFTKPRGLMPKEWRPKKVKILCKGARVAKYFGEDTMGTRQVEVSVKFFDCDHFYMKQSLPGSGPKPYQIIFEGRWEETERGFRLQYLIRYTGQTSKMSEMDLAISALPPNQESFISATGEFYENRNQLNGLIPAIVGEEQYGRVEIFREPDVVEKAPARFNEDCPDPPSWKDPTPTGFKRKEKQEKQEAKVTDDEPPPRSFEPRFKNANCAPRVWSEDSEHSAKAENKTRGDSGDFMDEPKMRQEPHMRHTAAAEASRCRSAGPTPVEHPATEGLQQKDEEPMWPMMLGLALFIFVFMLFGWLNYGEMIKDMFPPMSSISSAAKEVPDPDIEEW